MNKYLAFVLFALGGMVLFNGCATTERVTLSPDFLHQKDQTIGVALVEISGRKVLNFSAMTGLRAEAEMARATNPLQQYLWRTYPRNFPRIQGLFVEKLKLEGFKVIQVKEIIKLKDLPTGKVATSEYGLKAGVDRLLAFKFGYHVDCIFLGTTLSQGTKIDLGVTGEMLDVKSNRLLWRKYSKGGSDVVAKCIEPSDFPIIMNAIEKEIDKVAIDLYESFFGEKPSHY